MFCKEQVAQLRDYAPRIHAAGGELIILGNGTPQQAAWFVEDFGVTTPVFTDPELRSHTIVGARRGFRVVTLKTFLRAREARSKGFRQEQTKGSATQLGGLFVIRGDGSLAYRYLSKFAGDHPDPEEAVGALERAAIPSADA